RIHCNGAGINLSGVANNNIQPPVINEVTSTTVGGEGIDGDEVHVYRDNSGCTPSAGQGQEYLGTATVSGGVWQLSGLSIAIGTDLITATATNGTDGTSEFVGQDSYIVTNITDAGIGSLRWAITNANASTNPSVTISFNIGSSAPWIIQPTSALPTINNVGAVPIIIDATTQLGWAFGDPNAMIHIEGSLAGGSTVALIVQEANVEIYGLVLDGFFHGIRINTGADGLIIGAPGKGNVIKGLTGWGIISGGVAGNVTIQSNYIGTSVDGLSMDANLGAGIGVEGDNILIGGNSTLGEGNVISNNGSGGFEYGIYTGTGDNIEIYGNLIGTDKNGENDFGNLRGIWVLNGASNVTIGGTGTGQRNVISGTFSAFSVHLQSVDNVIVDNNFIGLNSAGTTAIPNTRNGIDIDASGSGAIIRNNTIAASTEDGIYMESETADVIIENNMIGTTPTGVAGTGLGNRNGIVFNSSGGIDNTTQRIRISGNVISGNSADGINFNSTCSNFILTDNLIGVESDGTTPLGNAGSGIELSSTTTNIEIGGTSQENSIANNTLAGIRFEGLAQETSGTIIGVNSYFCNSTDAIDFVLTPTVDAPVITTISSGSIDGTSTEPDGTLIDVYETDLSCADNQGATYLGQTTVTSGNWSLSGSFTTSNSFVATATDPTDGISEFSLAVTSTLYVVTNTNDSGVGSLRQAITNANASSGETISFNIPGAGPWDITLLSNLPNLLSTMTIDGTTQPGSTSTNLIGIRATAACDRGLAIVTNDCEIYGLEITGFNGSGDFGGIYMGLSVTSGQIGAALKGNVLSNNRYGLQIQGDNVVVQGNKFGTDNTGFFANGNTETGIYIISGDGNTIGGAGANEGNLISGNSQLGIRMANSDNNTVQGNIIGMNAAGLSRVSNGISGIGIGGGTTFTSNGNTIGGAGANEGNLISGNSVYGITLSYGSNNLILGNRIGLDSNGDQFNFTPFGILIGGAFGEVATDNTVGGIGPGEANSIAGHSGRGVWLQVNTGTSERNTIRGNAIYCNGELGITLNAGTNNDISAPIITDFTAGIGTATVTGECPTCTTGDLIDVYRDNSACADGQGQEYLGTVTFGTDPWTLGGLTLSSDDQLTVMVTDISGNSSEFGPAAPEIVVYEGAGTAGTEITDAQVSVIDLGTSDQGVDLTFDVTIENVGSAFLTVASITSSASEYSFVSTPTTVNAGENATFTIQLDATDVGTFPSTITINSDDSDENPFTFSVTGEITGPEIELYVGTDNTGTLLSDAQPTAIDFGSVLAGTDLVLDFAIENTGTAVLNISSIGSSESEYSVTGAPSSVAIGATATFTITLDGSTSGIFNSTITISSDDADENPFTFPVTGEIIAPEPEIEVYVGQLHPSAILVDGQVTEVDLGRTVNGNSITVLFYIENTGAVALNISNITSDQTEFSIVGAPTSVAAGGSETFDMVLDGSITGIFNATITITSDDLDESPFTFPVMGQITEPEIEVYFGNNNTGAPITNGQASEVDIGTSALGNNLSETFAIENLGTSLLTISSITSSNPDFTITSAPTSVGEGATEIFFIELDASVAGSFTTTITIVSDDLDEGTFTFPVTGSIVESLDILFYYEDSPL
ncbi:MAG: choice-of-anchor D domain-containing protein, partial [Cyclobacteriaceae bacterium]